MSNSQSRICTAQSCASDPRAAVREFHAGVNQADLALVLFFCSSAYDLAALADEMNRLFPGVLVVGCTTAGEIGPGGYLDHGLAGASFSNPACTAVAGRLDALQQFTIGEGQALARTLVERLESLAPAAAVGNSFAFLMIDGLSRREEPVVRALQGGLGRIALVGGSAGDDLKLDHTWVFHDGAFHTDSAVLLLATTPLPFRTFKTQHFAGGEERLVVTEADVGRRTVREINGLPAAAEYARLVGVPVDELGPRCFAASPVVVSIDGVDYVRSIQRVKADGSLVFYCAIDEGLVLRVVHGGDLVANLEHTFAALAGDIGRPQLVLACDCILRNLEIGEKGLKDTVGEIFRRHHAVGFSTYGEQYRGVHVNQTLTGIAFGESPHAPDPA